MLGKAINLPTNLLVRNLREMIMRAEEEGDVDMEINGVSQLSILAQGKNSSVPSDMVDFGLFYC